MENQELRLMDVLLNPGDEDLVFIYSKAQNKDFAMSLRTLLAKLQAPDSPAKYLFKPVASLAELKDIDTANNTLWPDNWLIQVKGMGVYALDRASMAEPNDNTVITAKGSGRWIGKGTTDQANSDYVSKRNGGTFEKDIAVQGLVTAQNFVFGSDRRFKDNIAPLTDTLDPLALLQRLVFNRYTWCDSDKVGYGVVAQELREVAPELVEERDERLFVDLYSLVALQGAAIQQLANRIEKLEAERHG